MRFKYTVKLCRLNKRRWKNLCFNCQKSISCFVINIFCSYHITCINIKMLSNLLKKYISRIIVESIMDDLQKIWSNL